MECRICLQEYLLTSAAPVCRCKGNHKNVHEQCLKQWAEHASKFRDEHGSAYFHCDLCKERIFLRYGRQCALKSCEEVKGEVREHWCKMILIVLVFALFLVVLIVSAHSLRGSPDNWAIFVTLIAISSVMVLATLPLMLFRLLVKQRRVIDGFQAGEKGRGNRIANSFSETQLDL